MQLLICGLACAGVDAESVLKISGQGDAGRGGGAPGDLYITFAVQASAGMRRQGLDMHSDVSQSPLPGTQTHTLLLSIRLHLTCCNRWTSCPFSALHRRC